MDKETFLFILMLMKKNYIHVDQAERFVKSDLNIQQIDILLDYTASEEKRLQKEKEEAEKKAQREEEAAQRQAEREAFGFMGTDKYVSDGVTEAQPEEEYRQTKKPYLPKKKS